MTLGEQHPTLTRRTRKGLRRVICPELWVLLGHGKTLLIEFPIFGVLIEILLPIQDTSVYMKGIWIFLTHFYETKPLSTFIPLFKIWFCTLYIEYNFEFSKGWKINCQTPGLSSNFTFFEWWKFSVLSVIWLSWITLAANTQILPSIV